MALLDADRLFPLDPGARTLARELHGAVATAPIVSPHGHTDPRWFAENAPFPDPARLFVTPDHYLFRMLHSQGVPLDRLGVPRADGGPTETDGRAIWRLFADHYHLFRGTPSRLWLDHAFQEVFGIDQPLGPATADAIYDRIADCLARPDYRPRALFERFGIEVLATTEGPLDDLRWHARIRDSGWSGRVITTYRPDAVTDPDFEGFTQNIEAFCALAGEDPARYDGYLDAHRARRAFFRGFGATATDHGHPSAATADLPSAEAEALYGKVRSGRADAAEREAFRAQMLTEMARLSLEDGLVMQIHPGAFRNHSAPVLARHGRDKGYDIPTRTDYVRALKPLLDAVGEEPGLTVILFTLDETAYARELAPLAGVYPCLRLGPPWWFHDSFEGMTRFRQSATETAGFYNTVGFNDDTRAFCSIPARHDVARRVDAAFLATLVRSGRLTGNEAHEVIHDLAHRLARKAYRL
ncbi:glucuronate isomerase [Rhodovulum kholense]|uniref:Uronate isomerase n=1 Tax=Rhodovulum kholense TaxID=453584 RepID=A0A8E2VI55_9RHOB|nr:glucuronate isomerase [Rhodovulum kholense]PTW45647.1 glucuronate isomerase [Rhodovulum kholense]